MRFDPADRRDTESRGIGMAKIVVIDGQGGRLGKLLVEEVRARLPQAELLAIGTNGIASSAM